MVVAVCHGCGSLTWLSLITNLGGAEGRFLYIVHDMPKSMKTPWWDLNSIVLLKSHL